MEQRFYEDIVLCTHTKLEFVNSYMHKYYQLVAILPSKSGVNFVSAHVLRDEHSSEAKTNELRWCNYRLFYGKMWKGIPYAHS